MHLYYVDRYKYFTPHMLYYRGLQTPASQCSNLQRLRAPTRNARVVMELWQITDTQPLTAQAPPLGWPDPRSMAHGHLPPLRDPHSVEFRTAGYNSPVLLRCLPSPSNGKQTHPSPGVDSVLCKELLRYVITPDCKFPSLHFHLLIPPIFLQSSGVNQQQPHAAKGGSALRWEFAHWGCHLTASACPTANSSTKLTLTCTCSECACSKQTFMKQITVDEAICSVSH